MASDIQEREAEEGKEGCAGNEESETMWGEEGPKRSFREFCFGVTAKPWRISSNLEFLEKR